MPVGVSVQREIEELRRRVSALEEKIDYIISLMEDELTEEEVEELKRRVDRLSKGEVKTYTFDEVLKELNA